MHIIFAVYSQKFLDKGIKVSQLDPDALAEIQRLSFQALEKEAVRNPLFAKVIYSQFKAAELIQVWRSKMKGLAELQEKLPNMELLRKEAAKAK